MSDQLPNVWLIRELTTTDVVENTTDRERARELVADYGPETHWLDGPYGVEVESEEEREARHRTNSARANRDAVHLGLTGRVSFTPRQHSPIKRRKARQRVAESRRRRLESEGEL